MKRLVPAAAAVLILAAWPSLSTPSARSTGAGSPRLSEDLVSIGNGPILFGLIIPWTYVWSRYVRAPAERWR